MDLADIVGKVGEQYLCRINSLKFSGYNTQCIEETVAKTSKNLFESEGKSFVIYGEPQSGKTEMMIALTAKLLDDDTKVIIHLVTDSVDLLEQNLSRFKASGLSPSPKRYNDLPRRWQDLGEKNWVVFSKKNARDLEKLSHLFCRKKDIVIIDDEADFATPNSKVNQDTRTKINKLIHGLLNDSGRYIGVTATPARLDLNNTFENDSELWVDFRPHDLYVGQDFFFPLDGTVEYRLHTFEADEGSERNELENAVLNFLCGVAEQHERDFKNNFTMLVHTSGKRDEHQKDINVIQETLTKLSTPSCAAFKKVSAKLKSVSKDYSHTCPDTIVKFVLRNINRNQVTEINSGENSGKVYEIANPTSLFSFVAGGNIISRGVTLNNLLSMYFTRAVKGKFTQDT